MRYFSMFSGIGGFEYGIQQSLRNTIEPKEQSKKCAVFDKGISTNTPNSDGNRGWSSATCVGYSEIDKYAIKVYERNFNGDTVNRGNTGTPTLENRQTQPNTNISNGNGRRTDTANNGNGGHKNYGNATTINATELPDFDLLVGGFPCQAFSIAGKRAGFDDTRGTLFFDIARILKEKQPRNLVLENVKGLLSHDGGRTFTTIIGVLADLGYFVEWQVLNSKDFGVPQNRERVFIVGHLGGQPRRKVFPITGDSQQIASVAGYISEEVWPRRHEQIRRTYNTDGAMPTIPTGQGGGVMTKIVTPVLTPNRLEKRQNGRRFKEAGDPSFTLTGQDIHGVKEGLRIRRLTPLECERLQGFPDNWTALGVGDEPISDTQRYKMCGNAVTTNVITAVMEKLL